MLNTYMLNCLYSSLKLKIKLIKCWLCSKGWMVGIASGNDHAQLSCLQNFFEQRVLLLLAFYVRSHTRLTRGSCGNRSPPQGWEFDKRRITISRIPDFLGTPAWHTIHARLWWHLSVATYWINEFNHCFPKPVNY